MPGGLNGGMAHSFSTTELGCPEPCPETPISGPEAISFSSPNSHHFPHLQEVWLPPGELHLSPLHLMLSQGMFSKTSGEKKSKGIRLKDWNSWSEKKFPEKGGPIYTEGGSSFSEWNRLLSFLLHLHTSGVRALCSSYTPSSVHMLFCPRTEPEQVTWASLPAGSRVTTSLPFVDQLWNFIHGKGDLQGILEEGRKKFTGHKRHGMVQPSTFTEMNPDFNFWHDASSHGMENITRILQAWFENIQHEERAEHSSRESRCQLYFWQNIPSTCMK